MEDSAIVKKAIAGNQLLRAKNISLLKANISLKRQLIKKDEIIIEKNRQLIKKTDRIISLVSTQTKSGETNGPT